MMSEWDVLIVCVQESIPFAVVGTDKEHQVNGNKVLGRKTKWGIIEGKAAVWPRSHLVYHLLITVPLCADCDLIFGKADE